MAESKNTGIVTDLDREETPHAAAAASPTEIDRLRARLAEVETENLRLTLLLNTPEVTDFAKGVVLETLHQRERWGSEPDEGKTPFDWFWLVGYLAQKAAASHLAGDRSRRCTILSAPPPRSTIGTLQSWGLLGCVPASGLVMQRSTL